MLPVLLLLHIDGFSISLPADFGTSDPFNPLLHRHPPLGAIFIKTPLFRRIEKQLELPEAKKTTTTMVQDLSLSFSPPFTPSV